MVSTVESLTIYKLTISSTTFGGMSHSQVLPSIQRHVMDLELLLLELGSVFLGMALSVMELEASKSMQRTLKHRWNFEHLGKMLSFSVLQIQQDLSFMRCILLLVS